MLVALSSAFLHCTLPPPPKDTLAEFLSVSPPPSSSLHRFSLVVHFIVRVCERLPLNWIRGGFAELSYYVNRGKMSVPWRILAEPRYQQLLGTIREWKHCCCERDGFDRNSIRATILTGEGFSSPSDGRRLENLKSIPRIYISRAILRVLR